MSDISDELRKFTNTYHLNSLQIYELKRIADRIDAEMAELPRAADGPIHLDDTVFTKDDPGTSWGVRYIELSRDREPSIGIESGGVNTYRPPSCLTHERPDSWERIADELDEWRVHAAGDCRIKVTDEDIVHDLADRIRKLAKKEDR